MKRNGKLQSLLVIISLISLTGCIEGNYCDSYRLDKNVEVDFYFFGTVQCFDDNNQDVTAAFAGTNYRLEFQKIDCANTGESPLFYYDYVLKEDGTLYRYQNTPYSFTMDNEEDHFLLIFNRVHDDGSLECLTPGDTYAYYDEWKSGKLRAEVTISFYHSDPENLTNVGHDLLINYLD